MSQQIYGQWSKLSHCLICLSFTADNNLHYHDDDGDCRHDWTIIYSCVCVIELNFIKKKIKIKQQDCQVMAIIMNHINNHTIT